MPLIFSEECYIHVVTIKPLISIPLLEFTETTDVQETCLKSFAGNFTPCYNALIIGEKLFLNAKCLQSDTSRRVGF